jgi:multidrug efflux pump subunit AcrB
MTGRLTGIVATLWFFTAMLSLFIAMVFSPMGLGLLLLDSHPVTWCRWRSKMPHNGHLKIPHFF